MIEFGLLIRWTPSQIFSINHQDGPMILLTPQVLLDCVSAIQMTCWPFQYFTMSNHCVMCWLCPPLLYNSSDCNHDKNYNYFKYPYTGFLWHSHILIDISYVKWQLANSENMTLKCCVITSSCTGNHDPTMWVAIYMWPGQRKGSKWAHKIWPSFSNLLHHNKRCI